jgi:hypothetical protein
MLCCAVQVLESIAIKVNLEDKESLIRAANTWVTLWGGVQLGIRGVCCQQVVGLAGGVCVLRGGCIRSSQARWDVCRHTG